MVKSYSLPTSHGRCRRASRRSMRSEAHAVRPRPDAGCITEGGVVRRAVAEVGIDDGLNVVEGIHHVELGVEREAPLEAPLVAGEERDELLVGHVEWPAHRRCGIRAVGVVVGDLVAAEAIVATEAEPAQPPVRKPIVGGRRERDRRVARFDVPAFAHHIGRTTRGNEPELMPGYGQTSHACAHGGRIEIERTGVRDLPAVGLEGGAIISVRIAVPKHL